MTIKRRLSNLQRWIILYVGDRDNGVKNIAEMARDLDRQRPPVSRPSVSRSIHTLEDIGFVYKIDGVWKLTEDGKARRDGFVLDLKRQAVNLSLILKRMAIFIGDHNDDKKR